MSVIKMSENKKKAYFFLQGCKFICGFFCILCMAGVPAYAGEKTDSVAQEYVAQAKKLSANNQDKEAYALYHKAAERGYAPAQSALAWIYHQGIVVPRDNVKALKWAQQAAEQRDGSAQLFLGVCYSLGVPEAKVPVDLEKTLFWYKQAGLQGESGVSEMIDHIYTAGDTYFQEAEALYEEQRYEEAFPLYLKAAKLDVVQAQAMVAWLYNQGRGTPLDKDVSYEDAQALYWARLAAEQGNTSGMLYVAGMHAVNKEYAKAFPLYLRAAEKGDISAMEYVMEFYAAGLGMEKDASKAQYWATKVAEAERLAAKEALQKETSKK